MNFEKSIQDWVALDNQLKKLNEKLKQIKEEEYYLVIEWEDDSYIIQNTIFEFSGIGCSSMANNAFNRLCKYVKLKPVSNKSDSFSSADEILKFSKLKDEGIISEEEFEKKKKELLDNA